METINKNKDVLDERSRQLQNQIKLNKEEEERIVMANRDISEKKN